MKQIDKLTEGKLLSQYPDADWRSIMRTRDVISHHYFNVNAEIVYGVCKKDIEPLGQQIERILDEFQA